MMDCNDTKTFLSEWYRMCIGYKTYTQIETECKMHHACRMCVNCKKWVTGNPEAAIEIVQEWSDAHPPKTRLSVFLEAFPNAVMKSEDALPISCARLIFGFDKCEKKSCTECWNTPIEQGVQ